MRKNKKIKNKLNIVYDFLNKFKHIMEKYLKKKPKCNDAIIKHTKTKQKLKQLKEEPTHAQHFISESETSDSSDSSDSDYEELLIDLEKPKLKRQTAQPQVEKPKPKNKTQLMEEEIAKLEKERSKPIPIPKAKKKKKPRVKVIKKYYMHKSAREEAKPKTQEPQPVKQNPIINTIKTKLLNF